jgi:hypothetical protein
VFLVDWYYLLIIPAYKLVVNAVNWCRLNRLENQYYLWLKDYTDFAHLAEKRQLLKKLMKTANVADAYVNRTQPMGFGIIASGKCNVFEQFPSNESDIVKITLYKISEARGVFKANFWETFNPLYWIQFVLFLPKKMLTYLGTSPDFVITKLCQLIWWIAWASVSALKIMYPDFFPTVLPQLLHSIAQLF